MANSRVTALICTTAGIALSGCAHHGGMAAKGVEVTTEASGQVASGIGHAAAAPLRDLNLIRDKIPGVLIRAEDRPYEIAGIDSCESILAEVTALDEALGPDVDQPRLEVDRMHRGASYAAQAALDGVKDLAEGVIPMRSWVKRLSGATRAEAEARRAVMAGAVRRGFLKALGMSRNCEWPASPMGFVPTQIAAAPPPPAQTVVSTAAAAPGDAAGAAPPALATPVASPLPAAPHASAPATTVGFAAHRPSGR